MSLKTRLTSGVAQFLVPTVLATGTFASASPVSGTLHIAGTAVVSLLGIDFVPPAAAGVGEIVVLPGGNTGDFAFLNAGFNTGLIVDRDQSQPVGEMLNVPGWLTIPNFSFDLRFIRPGSFSSADCFIPPAADQTCTPPPFDPDGPGPLPALLSPYNLANATDTNGNISSSAAFFVAGVATNLLDPTDQGAFLGQFTTTDLTVPYQELLNTVLAGGTVTLPFSATFIAVDDVLIPEPSTLALALGGAALLGAGLLRRPKLPSATKPGALPPKSDIEN